MSGAIDLAAYCERIGYHGPRTATLETLRRIHELHPQAIAFENLDPLLGITPGLDAASLERKLVRDGRGGYCYEQNLLLQHALAAMGFQVGGLSARVLWGAPDGYVGPRDHMLLRVDLDGESWIADVGFGGQTPTAPLRLGTDEPQSTPHERYRIRPSGSDFVLEMEIRGAWRPVYRFDLRAELLPDYEAMNWYVSRHPQSHFTTGLSVARMAPGRRHTLRNADLAVHDSARATTRRRRVESARELRDVLQDTMGMRLPDHPELEAVLARVVADAAEAQGAGAEEAPVAAPAEAPVATPADAPVAATKEARPGVRKVAAASRIRPPVPADASR